MRNRRTRRGWRWAIRSALVSAARTPGAIARRELQWKGPLLGHRLVGPDGHQYEVFRDTGRHPPVDGAAAHEGVPAVLVAGFRFAWLGRTGSWRHRLFHHVCVVTVPLFSGLDGYRRKLWLREVGGDRYLGVYAWAGAAEAADYVEALVPILRLLGGPGSVHATVLEGTALDAHLVAMHDTAPPGQAAA